MTNRQGRSGGMGGGIMAIVMLVLVLAIVWFAVKGLFTLIWWIAPVLFIATLFLNYRVFIDHFNFIKTAFQKSPVNGLLYGAGTFFLFPLVLLYLFAKALIGYQVKKKFGPKKKKYDDYEIVEEKVEEEEDFLELPEIEKVEPLKKNNEYEDLF